MEITHKTGDRYIVTGITTNGAKFRKEYANPYFALAINLYNGNVWQLRDGKRKLVKQVRN